MLHKLTTDLNSTSLTPFWPRRQSMMLEVVHRHEKPAPDRVALIYIANIYHWYIYISNIYPIFLFENIWYFRFLSSFKNIFNVTQCDYVLICSPCVLLAYDLCRRHFLNVGQLLSDCTSPQQCSVNDKSTSPNMKCTHTYYYLVVNFI